MSALPQPIQPAPLCSESQLRVIAPSGPFDAALLRAGLAHLREYQVELDDTLNCSPAGFLAATDEMRLSALQRALDDPQLDAIWIARGGYGLSRILPAVDWAGFQRQPKWLIGFSDVTALHCAALKSGVMSLHGPNLTSLAALDAPAFASVDSMLKGDFSGSSKVRLRALNQTAQSRSGQLLDSQGSCLVGGNLTVLFAEAAAGRLFVPPDALLLLEDVAETSYRCDRMLTALAQNPALGKLKGVIFGEFKDCSPGRWDVPIDTVLDEWAEKSPFPVWKEAPVGHGTVNHAFLHGGRPPGWRLA
ncbi:MAG: LD-carboxypeptidase [Polyangiaceae bacterium]|nr:LD-carboxypeptidase [Polyangiaceae bacterium]